jgi:hypothetical protein
MAVRVKWAEPGKDLLLLSGVLAAVGKTDDVEHLFVCFVCTPQEHRIGLRWLVRLTGSLPCGDCLSSSQVLGSHTLRRAQ